jgi:hypothetical protein
MRLAAPGIKIVRHPRSLSCTEGGTIMTMHASGMTERSIRDTEKRGD